MATPGPATVASVLKRDRESLRLKVCFKATRKMRLSINADQLTLSPSNVVFSSARSENDVFVHCSLKPQPRGCSVLRCTRPLGLPHRLSRCQMLTLTPTLLQRQQFSTMKVDTTTPFVGSIVCAYKKTLYTPVYKSSRPIAICLHLVSGEGFLSPVQRLLSARIVLRRRPPGRNGRPRRR